jgi:hypothetical protein
LPPGGIREVRGGYTIEETGEHIPYERVIWQSEDGAWWRCRNLQSNLTRCLIGPPGSTLHTPLVMPASHRH